MYGDIRKELAKGFRLTTNNRMEILGCLSGLQALREPCEVTVYSDSRYVVDAMTKFWAVNWRRNGWKRKAGTGWAPASNADLWAPMLEICETHKVDFNWVRGHAGNAGNERCDELARMAAIAEDLAIDRVYEELRRETSVLDL
jgi:ribonuclease HI